MGKFKCSLLQRKTYDVHFRETDSGIRDIVILNGCSKDDVKRIMKKRFKGWIPTKIRLHE